MGTHLGIAPAGVLEERSTQSAFVCNVSVGTVKLGLAAELELTDTESLRNPWQVPDLRRKVSNQRQHASWTGTEETYRLYSNLRHGEVALLVQANLAIGHPALVSDGRALWGPEDSTYILPVRTLSSNSTS